MIIVMLISVVIFVLIKMVGLLNVNAFGALILRIIVEGYQ